MDNSIENYQDTLFFIYSVSVVKYKSKWIQIVLNLFFLYII